MLAVPPKQIVISCDQATTGCQGVQQADATAPTVYYLFKFDPNNKTEPGPRGDGRGPEALRHRGRHQHAGPGQRRAARLHRQGRRQVPRHHARGGATRRGGRGGRRPDRQRRRHDPAVRAALRDRARRPAPVDAVHRLQAEPGRDRPDGHGRRDLEHLEHRRGEGPGARPADRRAAGRVPADRAHRRLGHARQGLAQGGEARRPDRPARRRGLPARALPLPRRRRGRRPRHLRGLPLRGDPGLQRHADAAGLRRPDPDDRRRGRRERRHLRTDQGRSARPGSPCAPRSRPATRRASTRSSTPTS